MKYFLIVAVLIISGCQQPANSLSDFSLDNSLMGVNSTCETSKIAGKNFKSVWTRMRSGFCFSSINSSQNI